MIGTAVQADYVIPGVRSLTAKEYQLAWALMGMNAISNCYEGPARSISRREAFAYSRVVGEVQDEILRREPHIDAYLLLLDVLRGARHPFVERNPSGWICNYARVIVARIYYAQFPTQCPSIAGCERVSKACPAVTAGGVSKYEVCPDSEIEELARSGYLPVKP